MGIHLPQTQLSCWFNDRQHKSKVKLFSAIQTLKEEETKLVLFSPSAAHHLVKVDAKDIPLLKTYFIKSKLLLALLNTAH